MSCQTKPHRQQNFLVLVAAIFMLITIVLCSVFFEDRMPSLPLFIDVRHGPVVLVGGTPQALSKLAILRGLGANVRWYPLAGAAVDVPVGESDVETFEGEPTSEQLHAVIAVVVATSADIAVRVAAAAKRASIPVNVVDRPDVSTFMFPALVQRGDVVVAIGTNGAAPVLARRLRERIEGMLPSRLGDLAAFLSKWRSWLRLNGPAVSDRALWQEVIDGQIGRHVLDGRLDEADNKMLPLLLQHKGDVKPTRGTVALVGAGPGDPDLLTLKALRALQDADIVFYDDLVTPEILDVARRDAAKVFVGKRKGRPSERQEEINRRLIAAARQGLRVVRLKGGDPFIFGRGGEELEALRRAEVAVSIIPGITAALGCAAEAELPLTYRSEATELLVITARNANCVRTDWSAASDERTTVVVYMGLSSAVEVRDGLIAAGRSSSTPAAVLARGTRRDSAVAVGPLSELPALAAQVGEGPAILMIGESIRHSRPWLDQQADDKPALVA